MGDMYARRCALNAQNAPLRNGVIAATKESRFFILNPDKRNFVVQRATQNQTKILRDHIL
jgi:hypothetical protein